MKRFGYTPNPAGTERVIAELPRPEFATSASPEVFAKDEQEEILTIPLLQAHPNFSRGAQGIGSCVGWGWALCVWIRSCVESLVLHESESPSPRVLEASIYAFSRVEAIGKERGGWSDGSYGGAAAKAVTRCGTLHYLDYGEGSDFRKYSAEREKQWGNYGVPDNLEGKAKEHTIKTASVVRSFEEAGRAIGIAKSPVAVCSGQGFTMSRDSDGFCKARGSWSHCMAFVGVRYDRPGLLCANSWGSSNTGPHYPAQLPKSVQVCTFWVDADVADRMLRGGDSFAVSGYDGFPALDVNWREAWDTWA